MDKFNQDFGVWIRLGDAISGKAGCIQCTDDMTVPVVAALVVICTVLWAITADG